MTIAVFDTIEDALFEIRRGSLVIAVDDENRENEGDLICAADCITPQIINFMITHARGLLCAPCAPGILERLNLKLMTQEQLLPGYSGCKFTISVDAARCPGSGISAIDRAITIQTLINPKSTSADFHRPGHVFPLRACEDGVLEREGHTEAAVDLARLAGFSPAGVICEIIRSDGHMARLPDLIEFKQRFGLKLISIADLIRYRLKLPKIIARPVVQSAQTIMRE